MIVVKNHRTLADHTHQAPLDDNNQPMYKHVISQDVRSQLHAIQKVDAEQERRRHEIISDRQRRDQPDKGDDGNEDRLDESSGLPLKKKRRKESVKEGSKHLSEDVMKKITNQTALTAAGGLTKSWMLQATSEPTLPSPSPTTSSSTTPVQTPTSTIPSTSQSTTLASKARVRGRPSAVRGGRSLSSGRLISRDSASITANVTALAPPPRHANSTATRVTVKDALFVLERDRGGGGLGSAQNVLMKSYVKWLR